MNSMGNYHHFRFSHNQNDVKRIVKHNIKTVEIAKYHVKINEIK